MSQKKSDLSLEPKYYALEIVKAVIIALVLSLLLVLGAAFIIKTFNLDTSAVTVINQIIRSVSILVACLLSLRRPGSGWLRGVITGLVYSFFAFIIFSLLAGGFEFDITLLNNTVIGMVAGLISGIISMLVRRN